MIECQEKNCGRWFNPHDDVESIESDQGNYCSEMCAAKNISSGVFFAHYGSPTETDPEVLQALLDGESRAKAYRKAHDDWRATYARENTFPEGTPAWEAYEQTFDDLEGEFDEAP